MARRSGFIGVLNVIAREAARSQRQMEVAQRRAIKEQARALREQERYHAQLDKESKQQYLTDRLDTTDDLNKEINERIEELHSLLTHTLSIDDTISFNSLKIKDKYPPLNLPNELSKPLQPPNRDEFVNVVEKPSWFSKVFSKGNERYNSEIARAEKWYQESLDAYKKTVVLREKKIEHIRNEYEEGRKLFDQKIDQRNLEVVEFENAYRAGDHDAVITYNNMVLERSEYPDEFPQNFRLAYVSESKELVVDYELPTWNVIPNVLEYRYIKTKDQIEEKLRKQPEIKEIYQEVVGAVTIRTIHEVFEADQGGNIQVVVFNGFVNTVDPSTGKNVKPFIISARATKDVFMDFNLAQIDIRACLRSLGAQVSPHPEALVPVKPIVEFDMVDRRFIEHGDIMSGLEDRPNLMDMNPFEFENLVCNLFEKMGLESKLTRSSKDGGVDSVAFDTRPVLGGKVVIQAKRYKNTVGVSAVRDLYGTMLNEGANKGILVTTSGYGPDAFEFAKDKPIELIDGGGLLYMLDQVGIIAQIILPK